MRVQKLLDKFRFMSREVISNDMNLSPPRLAGYHVSEKGDELLTGMARSRAANDCSCLGVQRGVQREGAMTVVLKSMSLCSARRQWQYRIQPVQRLHAGLFINAENDRMLRRLHIESNDVGRFLLKVGIVGHHVALDPLGLKSRSFPDSGHHHVVNAQMVGQFTRAPVRRTVARLPARPF